MKPFAALTATDNHGLWAGVRYDGMWTIQVIAWRAGRTTVLDTFSYRNTAFYPPTSVKVLGVTNTDAVIVDAQDPLVARTGPDSLPYRYQGGHRYGYGHNGSWTSWDASSTTADGHVAGTASTPNGPLVVEWGPAGTPTVIAKGGNAMIDGYGDMIWSPTGSDVGVHDFRTPSGKLGQLVPETPDPVVRFTAGRWVYGDAGGYPPGFALARWDMASATTSAEIHPIQRAQALTYAVAGGWTGGFVAGSDLASAATQQYAYYDPYGDRHELPSFRQAGDAPVPFFGFDANGTVSYSDASGRPTFMNCPLNYAKHNPRGVIYHGVVVNGQTLITGGSFDSDDVAGHDLVYIFDQTSPTRHLLATIIADQYDPSFSKAYGIGGNHRYRYTFPAVSGRHTYCAYGRNVSYGNQNTLLGCTTVTA